MTIFDYQRFVARLIVDEEFFDEFVKDRDEMIARSALAPPDSTWIAQLNTEELATFKDVVFGTRSIYFALVFDELRGRTTDERWDELLSLFTRQVVIRDSSNSANLDAFCTWLGGEFPGSAAAALAQYQMRLQLIGSTPAILGEPGTLQIAPRTFVFPSAFEFNELMDVEPADLWTIGRGEELRHYVLQSPAQSDDVAVIDVPSKVADLLIYVSRPRTHSRVRQAMAMDQVPYDELVAELTDAGLVVANR